MGVVLWSVLLGITEDRGNSEKNYINVFDFCANFDNLLAIVIGCDKSKQFYLIGCIQTIGKEVKQSFKRLEGITLLDRDSLLPLKKRRESLSSAK